MLTQCLENEENNDLLVCHVCQTSFITLHNKRSHYLGKMHTDNLWEQLNKLLGDASKTTSTKTTNSSSESALKKRKRKSVCCHGDEDQDDPNRGEPSRPSSGGKRRNRPGREAESPGDGHASGQNTRTAAESGASGDSAVPPGGNSPLPRGGSEEIRSDPPMLTDVQGSQELPPEVGGSMADPPGCRMGGLCDVVEAEDIPDDNIVQNDNVQGTPVITCSAQPGAAQAIPSDDTRTNPMSVSIGANESDMSCDTPTGEGCHGDSTLPQSSASHSLQEWAQGYTGETGAWCCYGSRSSGIQDQFQCVVVV